MTNLFYPSLALYLQKKFPPLHPPSPPAHNTHRIPIQNQRGSPRRTQKEHPLSLLSTPILDSFFPYPPPLLPRLTWAGWWGRDTGQWAVVRVGGEGEEIGELEEQVKIMRIGWADVGDVLDRNVDSGGSDWAERDDLLLTLVRDMAEAWEVETGQKCVRELGAASDVEDAVDPVGPCYILSPDVNAREGTGGIETIPLAHLAFSDLWSAPILNATEDLDSVPIGWAANAGNVYHSVAVLFHVSRSSSADFDGRWLEAVSKLAAEIQGEVFVEAQGPKGGAGDQTGEWLLSFTRSSNASSDSVAGEGSGVETDSPPLTPFTPPDAISSSPPTLVLFLYLLLIGTLLAQLSNATKVHSRFGLAFTGVVQLCCSAVMSFSVVALLGLNGWGSSQAQTVLPTYVLPFVIVVVGVENMSTLTKAVFSVPFSYSVPVRIGLGLSKVGTTIAITSLTDLMLLGVVWLCIGLRPVREFCLFASVVIITDWFMLHTFFLTVLSIDAQRLELADVLAPRSGGVATPASDEQEDGDESAAGGFSWRSVLKARTAKSGSLVLLLLSVGILYYITETRRSPYTTASLYGYKPLFSSSTTSKLPAATAIPTAVATTLKDLFGLSPAEKMWRALNPRGWPFVHVVVPAALILVLPKEGHHMLPSGIRKLSLPASRLLLPRLKPLFYLFKVVILPQAVTASALYILLLYLLKDADLLDAQRNRQGRGEVGESRPDSNPAKSKSPHELKVYMLPCSHASDLEILDSSADGKLVLSVGIDNSLYLWRFQDGGNGTREPLVSENLGKEDIGPIVATAFSPDGRWVGVCTKHGVIQIWRLADDATPAALQSRMLPNRSARVCEMVFGRLDDMDDPFAEPSIKDPVALVALRDGSVVLVDADAQTIEVGPMGANERCRFHFVSPTCILVVGMSGMKLWTRGKPWTATAIPSPVDRDDRVTSISSSTIDRKGVSMMLLVLGYRSGAIDVFDISGSLLVTLRSKSDAREKITKAQLQASSSKCPSCGADGTDGFFVVSSTHARVYLDRVLLRRSSYCKCSPQERSHSPSPSSKQLTTPLNVPRSKYSPGHSPSLLPPTPSNGEFPLSSHGHSARRLSGWQRDEAPASGPEADSSDVEVVSLGSVVSLSGGWELLPSAAMLVGIRRIGNGIDDSGWQIWWIDLGAGVNLNHDDVHQLNLPSLISNTLHNRGAAVESVSIKERRRERLLSQNGRAVFSAHGNGGAGSFSIPIHPSLAYVSVHPIRRKGRDSIVAGFGNRLGVIHIPLGSTAGTVEQGGARKPLPLAGATPPPPPARRLGLGLDDGKKSI
ncbi:hypothetical protein P7C73_g5258, partial [Tremellales sp. Uapishka_1]